MRLSPQVLLDTTRPLDQGRWIRTAPLILITAFALVSAVTAPTARDGGVVLAAVLTATLIATNLLPWRRWPANWQAVPALGYFGVVLALDYAAGSHVDFFYLTALPIIWLALFHSRPMMLGGLGLLSATLILPRLLLPEAYPDPRWGSITMAIVLSAIGGLAGQYLVSRVRAAAALSYTVARQARADRDLLHAYLDNAACLVAVMDRTGRIAHLNHHCEQLLGVRTEDVRGRQMWNATPDPDVARKFAGVVAGNWPMHIEDDVIAHDGSTRRVAWTATALVDDTGEVTHVISTGVDITEQRAAERHFANVLAASVDQMIFAADTDGVFTAFNTGGERMLGYSADELIGVATVEKLHLPGVLDELAHQLNFANFRDLLARAPADMPPFTHEWTLVRKDGSHVPVSMTINPMTISGTVLGYVAIARDITADREAAATMQAALDREREAKERLRELNQVKDDFVAMVSHDLRTPLTSIVGNTELLLDGDVGALAPTQRPLLEAVDRNARRLQALIGDLLIMSRIESGTLRLSLRPVSLEEVVEAALETLMPGQAPDVALEVVAPPEPVLVRGDPDQLERVTVNLVGNAFKFTPPGGRVDVAITAGAAHVQLRISDTGIGIPQEELPHVFERFFRSSRVQNRERPGSGLGLTIARSIVEQHGGTIQVASEPATGTTFTIELPRLATAADTPERERA